MKSNQITITKKQAEQFNRMRHALHTISKGYMTPEQVRKSEDAEFHGFAEALSMCYDNIQEEARITVKGIRKLVIDVPQAPSIPTA